MERNQYDQYVQRAVSSTVKTGVGTASRALKTLIKKKLAVLAKKVAVTVVKGLLVTLKAILAVIAPILPFILIGLLAIGLIYMVIIKPIGTYQELERMKEMGYEGPALAIYTDTYEDWDEQLDRETMDRYMALRDKCLEGLNEFERNQAQQYALPYSLVISAERLELFGWNSMFQNKTGLERWEARPEEVYEVLKTRYEWKDSKVEYKATYTYSYSYSYNWDEWIPPVYDENGNLIQEGYYVTRTETGSATGVLVELERMFDVRLLSKADNYENIFIHEYGDYTTDENIATGSREYYITDYSETVTHDSIQAAYDSYEGLLLELNWSDEIVKDAEKIKDNIIDSFEPGAYNIRFNFKFDIQNSSKYYQPLKTIYTDGVRFHRIRSYLEDRFELEVTDNDLKNLFLIAADHDEDFAYYFAGNDLGFASFSNIEKYAYMGTIIGDELAWPVPADLGQVITSYFGPRWGRLHGGVDIASYGGAHHPIIAAADGVISFAGPNGAYGNCVIIDHGTNDEGKKVTTLYGHLHVIHVRAGQPVERGDVIGLMGTTGRSTGVHLHFEVRINNQRLDPLLFFRPEVYQRFR